MKSEQFSKMVKACDGASLLKQVCILGGAGVVGSATLVAAAPARASTETGLENIEGAEPTLVETQAPPVVETSAEALLSPQVTAAPIVEATTPSPAATAPVPFVERAVTPAETAPEAAEAPALPEVGQIESVFIDPTDYTLGATASPGSPAVVFSERSTGCEFTLDQGQAGTAAGCSVGAANVTGADTQAIADAGESGFSVGPLSIDRNGVSLAGTTVISREYFNQKIRPLNLLRQGSQEFVFPLSIPSPITSLFGMRTHPIFGDRRFHTGTDLGAPEGTPVLATKDGEVQTADYLGGYGYTVILHHEAGTQETRYAHLSRILVKPGESVKQGEVVGLVGSTGNSTGPHLHFELRELTAHGWMLVNPDSLMSYTVANLVDALNNPLQALGLLPEDTEADSPEALQDLPYRPAQPNAS